MSVLALCGVAAILGLAAAYAAGQKGQGPPVPDEVRRVADGGMKAFLHAEGDKGLDRLGFRAAREVSNASVGEGLRVYELQPRLLLDRADAVSFEGLLEETGMWQLLVMDGTVPKAVLTVDRHQGAIQAVSIGGAGLAEQLNALLVRWPASTYDLRFVISHQAGAQFMDIGEGRQAGGRGAAPVGARCPRARRRIRSERREVGRVRARPPAAAGEIRNGQHGRSPMMSRATRTIANFVIAVVVCVATASALTVILNFPTGNPAQEHSEWCWGRHESGDSRLLRANGESVHDCQLRVRLPICGRSHRLLRDIGLLGRRHDGHVFDEL